MIIRTIDDTLLLLGSEYSHGYGPAPIPCQIDEEVEFLIEAIVKNGDDQSSDIVSKMNENHGFVLLAYAERMASLSIREKRADLLKTSISALTIASQLVYVKETLPVLSLLYCSSQKLGINPSKLFTSPTISSRSELTQYTDEFLNRSAEDRGIQAMGFTEGEDGQGFRYLRTW